MPATKPHRMNLEGNTKKYLYVQFIQTQRAIDVARQESRSFSNFCLFSSWQSSPSTRTDAHLSVSVSHTHTVQTTRLYNLPQTSITYKITPYASLTHTAVVLVFQFTEPHWLYHIHYTVHKHSVTVHFVHCQVLYNFHLCIHACLSYSSSKSIHLHSKHAKPHLPDDNRAAEYNRSIHCGRRLHRQCVAKVHGAQLTFTSVSTTRRATCVIMCLCV